MVKKNRMQKLTAHAKVSQVHKAEKAPIGVAAGVALVSTLAIATPALATQQTKESDASLHDAIVAPANQGAQSPAAGVAGNTAAKAAAGTTDAASHPKAAKHSAKSTQAAQGTPVANGSNSDAAGTDRTAEPTTQNGSAPLHANNDEPAAQPTGAHNAESSSTAAATNTSVQPAENHVPAGMSAPNETPQGSTPTTPTRPKENDTSNQQVVKPNTEHTEASTLPVANSQVTPPENQRKMIYNFTVHYSVAGNQTKQLLQPTEFSFTEDKLNQITDNADDGVYIPVPTTKGYRAPRGNYVKDEHGKFVLDTEHNGLVQTYIKVDKALIEKNINKRLSKNGTVVSEYTLEYNPKQVTFYIRHMLQNPDYDPHISDPNDKRSKQFIEYTDLTNKVKLKDAEGHEHIVCVSKAVGLVGSQVFAQPVNIEGYSPEPNLVGSSIPDDANYTEADEDEASSTTPDASQTTPHKESKHLVFELRYLLKKHEVTYDVQGGTAIQGHVYKFGATMLEVNNPTRDGYKFMGWTVKGIKGKEHEAPSLDPNFTKQVLPDNDVKFVAHWEPAHKETTYWVNVWVQKARLVKPDDPNSLDNYDYVGRVQRTGKSDENISNTFTKYDPSFDAPTDKLNGKYRVIKGTLTAEERKQVHFDGLDTNNDRIKADVEKVLASDKEFDRFYKPNYQLENKLNAGVAPEWFGAKEMRPLYKLRPDGTTVLNAVYDRQVYTYYFAKPDGSKKSTDYVDSSKPGDPDYKGNARGSSTTVTIGGKKWTYDKDKLNSAYSIKVRFNEELRPGIEFPKTAQITYSPVDRTHDIDGREIDGSKEEPQANMGLYILGDATNMHKGKSDGDNVFDTPPYRFGFEDVYYTREVKGADFYNKKDFFCFSEHYHQGTSATEVGSYDYNPYQRLFTPFPMDTRQFDTGKPSNGPFHVVIRVETPESAAARLKDPSAKPQYKLSVMSYTQYNYIFRNGDISKSSLLGWDGFVGPNLIGYKTPSSTSGGDPSIWNNEDEYFFGNSEQKPILDPNASIPKTHMQCVYELLYQDYCTYLKAKGESPVALVGDKEKDKKEKDRFKAYVNAKWKDAFDFTYKKNSKGECVKEVTDKDGKTQELPVEHPFSAILVWTYDRTTPTIRFHNDASSDVEDAQGHAATIQSPFDTDLFKKDFIAGGHISDDGTTLTPTITPYTPEGKAPEQFPGTYRFQLNGKDYFIKRPDNLPKDYVFDGWALDANGSQVLIPHMKSDGTAMTAQDIIDYIKKQTTKRVVPDAGLSLYAHWVPSQITHKITVDMNRGDGSTSDVFVKHGACAHKAKNDGTVRDKKDIPKDEFPLAAERPGYVFYGWQVKTLDKQGNAHWLPFAFSTPVVDNLEVRAEWIEDKRVTGTVRQVFLNPGCTIKQYEAAKEEADRTGDRTKLESLIHNVRVETLHDLRPGSSTSVQAGYRDDEYFPDHTYSTFVVDTNESKNSAEFVYEPYAKRSYTVHYVDAAGKEIAPAEPQEGNASIYTTNKLNYNVVEAKTIPGYVLKNGVPAQHQFVIKPEQDGSYKKSYDYTFIYDDVRILKRKDDTQVTPTNYSRLVFKTESTELVVDSNKHVVSRISEQPGGELKPFAFAPTESAQNVSEIVLDAVNGTKAYQLPLPTPIAKDGYTFVGWTSEDYYADGKKYEGANRLPANSQTFDHKIVYIAHFKKTENAFVGSDPNAATPQGYYKVNYTADQNGRLSRVITDGHGNTRTETLDTLTNVVVLDKYKVNNIKAPTPVADKGFVATEGFSFDGNDAKDRTYTKHFVMIDPVAVAHRYVLPGNSVLAADETAKSLIQNADQYKNEEDGNPGKLATYRFLDEKGNVVATLDNTTPGEHKVFIEVEAGREGHRVKKKVPFFYTIMPRAFLQGDYNKYDPASVAANYKKYTFKSKREQGIMTGRETAQNVGDYETLAAYVYAGTATTPAGTYKLDVPAAAGRDFEANGYHYVFRGWKKLTTHDSTPADVPAHFKWKEFTPDIGPKDHYKDITPADNAAYVAMYEKIPYIVTKSEDGTVPPDSVVVSFKPAAGRTWKDGSTGPKVLYIKKGMDISRLDENGVPIKPNDHTTKSILQVLGEKLYGYTGDWTKSSMDGITLIENMSTGAGTDGWKSNNAFQEFVAHQTQYVDPVGGVEKTIVQGTAAPHAIDFVQNKNSFVPSETSTVESISAEYVKAPSTDAAANLTVPIKVTVKYKDSADATHTRVYNITGALHVLSDVLKSDSAPSDPALKDQYTTITFVSKKQDAPLKSDQTVADKEAPGQVSGATEGADQSELQYLAYKKTGAKYTIAIPQVTGKDYTENGYHYVFTGWKKVQNAAHPQDVLVDANQRTLSFDAEENVVYEAQYKKVPYITTKTDDGKVPDDSVVAAFKPAPGRTWKDGTNGPKTFYVKKGQDVHNLPFDIVVNGEKKHYKSIIDYFKDQLYENTGWSKSSMEDVQGIESVGEGDWIANNAFQEYVAKQTDYVAPTLGSAQTIIQGTQIPDAKTFISNISELQKDNVTNVSVEYTKQPSSQEAANYTVPLKVTVTYKDSASENHQKVYNLVGYLNVLGDVLSSKDAPQDETLKNQYTTITFVSKKQKVVDAQGHETSQTEEPGQVSGASESADHTQSELQYLTFKKTGANYTINIPKVSGLDYTANGYHYVFTGWKQVVTEGSTPAKTITATDRNYTFDAQQNIVFEAQYKKVPYIVTKVTDGKIPEDSVVVSFKPAPGRKWADGSTGPKVLYIKKGMDISRLDEHGRPIPAGDTTTPSILDVLGSKLSAYDHDWSKSSMDGITLIKSMKDSAGADGWKSNNAFQEFVAHQKPHTKPETIAEYQAIIQNTAVPTPYDFIKNDQDLKDLLIKNGVVVPGKENIESYTVEFVGKAPQSKIAGTYLVPLKVTIRYRDMDSADVFMLNSQLKVIYGVLYGKNKPSEAKQPIDYKVFNGNYRKVTFITDDNEKGQHKGTIIGDENSKSVDYYVAKDQELRVRVPKMLNQDYEKDGYHYRFVGWKLVPKADTAVKDDKHELTDTDIKFGTPNADSLKVTKTAGDLIYKAVYEKIKYVENKPVDGTVPADSVVVSFKPAPGRAWSDGSTGPKVLYIKKDTDISKIDKDGKPTNDPAKSILAELGEQLHGYEGDWSKSDMEGITAESSMNKAHKADPKAWLSKDAFQEFVAHQKAVVDPTVKNEIVITQYGDVPDAKAFIDNIKKLELDNIAKKDGKYDIEVHYGEDDSRRPKSDAAGVYTVPIFITVKHADMAAPIVYKLTSVLRVMDKVLPSTEADKIVTSIENKQKTATPGTEPDLTPKEKQFKDHYAKVVFSSGTDGTFEGGKDTSTHYVKKDTDITLDMPTVIAKEKQTDPQTGEKYRYIFTGWKLEITPNTPQGGTAGQGTQGGPQAQPTRTPRHRRSLDAVLPFTTLVQTDTPTETITPDITFTDDDLKLENLPKTLRKLEAKYGKTFTEATYKFVAQYIKQPYVIDASQQNTMHDGDVPVVFLPAPKHTWQDGSTRPYVYYVNTEAGDITNHVAELKAKLGSFTDWAVYDKTGALVTNPAEIAKALSTPKSACTFIAKQAEVPNLVPRDDVVITAGDGMPSYNEMVQDTPQINPETGQLLLEPNSQNPAMINGVEAFSTLKLNPRFAGWETDRDSYAKLSTDKPGIYRVRFGLKYYTDEQEITTTNKDGKIVKEAKVDENGKPIFKTAIKWVDVNVHILPRVITEQDVPADGTREAQFMKANYTKVTYRVALGDHGFLASPNTTFYVRRGYTIDPNALLNFDKDKRAKRLQEMQKHAVDEKQLKQEIGVPSAIAQPGYVFYEWQKHAANDQGDVVYLAHFHKLPITHFEFETSTEAEQSFSTRLIGDAQNYPTYKPKEGTKLPDGVTVTCKGDTCTVSGTPHITDWKDGEEQRTIELHFEAVDQRVTYDDNGVAQRTYRDADGKEHPVTDKYGRSSYGIQKEIIVRIVVKRPHPTTGGSHGGGSYGGGSYGGGESIPWTELTPAVEAPATPAPTPTPAEAPAPAPARPRVRAARHARLPQTGDSQLAATAAEILGMGAGMISLVAGARKKKRKHEDKGNENKN
ncbi:InlB B-repeat-containing protein [Fannyhessea vaginae]|nr:InlB B-repeat-containing protein [Fannyhessea vaginae]